MVLAECEKVASLLNTCTILLKISKSIYYSKDMLFGNVKTAFLVLKMAGDLYSHGTICICCKSDT